MRRIAALILFSLALPSVAFAQREGRGPHFLVAYADKPAPVRVDVKSVPALRRNLSLHLDHVTLGEALTQISQQAGLNLVYADDVVRAESRVSMRAEEITVAAALTHVLLDAGVDVVFTNHGIVTLIKQPKLAVLPTVGSVLGRVTDASSGAPTVGASVLLEGTAYGAPTGNTGRYSIANVPPGNYTVVVQHIGFADARKSVTVTEGVPVTADFHLAVAALPLDELVVTGTAFEAKLRSVPNPITVLRARDIEAKGASNITDLLRGEIPGVFALTVGQFDFSSTIYVRGNAGWASEDYIKIYIDGVEVANSRYLSTIDPKSIERIEVVRGPQASAIYGSEAASGVIQIFTKKGHAGLARPRLEFQASAGVMESEFTPSGVTPLTQDYSLGVSGGGEAFSYRAGASHATVGEWVKNYGSKTLSFSGGLRAVQGPLTAELTALWSDRDFHSPYFNLACRYPAFVSSSPTNAAQCDPDYFDNQDFALSQNTMGLKLGYRATSRWQHTLTLGDDQNRVSRHQPAPNRLTPADTFVALSNSETRRRSIRYHTAYDANVGESLTARFTAGADYWYYDVQGSSGYNLLNAFGNQVKQSSGTSASFTNDGWRNAGYFGMTELGWREQLYLTLTARVEEMRNLGEEYGRPVQPRVGASYVREVGPAEVKLRAQWGKGVRLPPAYARVGSESSIGDFTYSINLPNPLIGPEEKVGWDAGVDVYWGSRGSLSLTRYSEEGRNLIQSVTLDQGTWDWSTQTGDPVIYQFQNIGVVGSEGWEVEGSAHLGRLSLKANYAYSDNRIRSLSNAYTSRPNGAYQVGDRMFFIPTHSGGGTATFRFWRGSASVNASVMDEWRAMDWIAYNDNRYGGEPDRGSFRDYFVSYSDALWKGHLRAEQAVTERWTAFLRVDNLVTNQAADMENSLVAPGRTSVVGIRVVF